MKKLAVFAVLLLTIGFSWQCSSNQKQNDQKDEQQTKEQRDTAKKQDPQTNLNKRGKAVVKASGKALIGQLTKAIKEGGVSHAIKFCSVNALPITDSLSRVHNAQIDRVSHKNRNPENAADSLEMTLIRKYQQQNKADKPLKPELVTRNGDKVYYHPIKINNPLCLNCHGQKGKDIQQETYIMIKQLYKNDKATGFSMGDLRGMWKVAFKEQQI